MKELELAVLPMGTPLKKAFSTMREYGQSAIVTVKGTRPGVITAQQIVQGIRAGKSNLDDLAVPRIIVDGGRTPMAVPGGYRSPGVARAPKQSIRVVKIGVERASIIVNDGLAKKYLTYPAGCRCAKGDHYWEPWEAPEICPDDRTKVDCGRRK